MGREPFFKIILEPITPAQRAVIVSLWPELYCVATLTTHAEGKEGKEELG